MPCSPFWISPQWWPFTSPRPRSIWWVRFICCLHAVITLQSKEVGWGGEGWGVSLCPKALVAPRYKCMQPHHPSMKLSCVRNSPVRKFTYIYIYIKLHSARQSTPLLWRPSVYHTWWNRWSLPRQTVCCGLPTQLKGAIVATTLLRAGGVRFCRRDEPSLCLVKSDPPGNFCSRIRHHQWTRWICRGIKG